MNLNDSMELMKKYSTCPKCGNDKVGGEPSQGSLIIENDVFTRSCKCGWSVTVDKRIKIVASATKKVGRKTEGIYEVVMDDSKKHKYLPMNELKDFAGLKRSNQFKKAEDWLNTKEGREWAINTPHVAIF
jgi:hypothetical protein